MQLFFHKLQMGKRQAIASDYKYFFYLEKVRKQNVSSPAFLRDFGYVT